uniref:Uncharacterized protein n=1 Tax=Arundo donax TaxID=35708 RepID=A0A0A8ZBM6_ARUDO
MHMSSKEFYFWYATRDYRLIAYTSSITRWNLAVAVLCREPCLC